ncbi:MAG: hypothetical protein ONB31_03400 [candidate division KSB1 bacterium]|nr:hypothetical protein [candidate division KSB1 bacterium]MDZ7334723.1 hypothetical protein [candidate division KSB1 bacterium]MDZ7400370.1 hypothetical protein [candidate division KSB1 bacterium]
MTTFCKPYCGLIVCFHFCLLLISGSERDGSSKANVQPAINDSLRFAVIDSGQPNQELIPQDLDSLSKLIQSKQAVLQKTQQEIAVRSAQMQQDEQRLAKIVATMQRLRQTCYITLIIGAILILIGLVQMMIRRRSAGQDE